MRPRARLKRLLPGVRVGDERAIHEARKLTRRVAAELALAGAPRKLRRQWREFRRALAPLRDHDAAGTHLRGAFDALNVSGAQVQAFEQQWSAARGHHLRQLALPRLPPDGARPRHPRRRARQALQKLARQLTRDAELVLESGTPRDWHDWRKGLKRYRYTLELLAPTPTALRELLDALGRVQDADVLLTLLEDQNHQKHQAPAIPERAQVAAREAHLRQQAQQRARELWPEVAREMARWEG